MSLPTQHSVVKRGALTWNREQLPEAAYRRRIATLQARMAETGEDAWLLMGDVAAHGPVVWATNFMPRVRSALAFVPRQGEPTLFANISTRDIPAARTITWVEDIQAFSRLPKVLAEFIAQRLPGGGRIGICGIERSMPFADWRSIESELPLIRFADRDAELAALRAVKEPWEIAAVEQAAALAGMALSDARDAIRPGRSMGEAMARLDAQVRREGAEDVRFLVASGPETGVSLRPVNDRLLAAGDCVLIYVAVQRQRYWADAACSYAIGPPDQRLLELVAEARGALDAMLASAQAGVRASTVAKVGRRGLGTIAPSAEVYGLGNAIGLDASEGQEIAVHSVAQLRAKATMALRVIAHADGCGVALSRPALIGETGAAVIGSWPGDLVRIVP